MTVLLAILLSYLIGGIPVGVLLGRVKGVDIRKEGSGNIGATNVLRVLGVKYGLMAFAADVLKGAIPVLGARSYGLTGWPLYACGAAAVVGHCYSPYLKFAGGKAVATGLGILLALCWPAGLVCFGMWIAITAITRYVSVASMTAYAAAPAIARVFGADGPMIATFAFLAVLSILRHRENLARLLAGTESKIGQRSHGNAPTERTAAASEGGEQA